MKRAKATILPFPGSPNGAAYAGLKEVPTKTPPKRLKRVDRSEHKRRPRSLTQAQRDTFLGTAADRVREEAQNRQCKWLRPFDCFQSSGYRTHQMRWNSLAEIIEPVLARMDIATLVLGYIDKDTGEFRLNRQRGLAEDTTLQEWTVSRLFCALEASGYVRRKMRRIFHNGRYWITRVTINIRPRFFIDLGLGHMLAEARTNKRAKREQLLTNLGQKQATDRLQEAADKQMRRTSHNNAQRAAREQQAAAQEEQRVERERARVIAWTAFMAEPGIKDLPFSKRSKIFGQRYPHLI
ncbi:hypothetical protein AUC61_23845 [Pseudomonas sp. S25]|uniref:Replication protein n=1 Tax=Pseudomonas maioricensis TaxID=1766623 RepID=A0ABS9ZRP1_9PSED|nr:hypothetical protein [Pseudomonas sp. S25]MCI8212568.1 hypothetical protein [Pseudomonas sp. S25]